MKLLAVLTILFAFLSQFTAVNADSKYMSEKEVEQHLNHELPGTKHPAASLNSGGPDENENSALFSFVQDWPPLNFFNQQNFIVELFPDSTVNRIRFDENGNPSQDNPFTHSIGANFDPRGFYIDDVFSHAIDTNQTYTIDGISFNYYYGRQIDEVTMYDTSWKDTTVYNFTVDGDTTGEYSYMTEATYTIVYDDTAEEYDSTEQSPSVVDFYQDEYPFDITESVTAWPPYHIEDQDSSGQATDTNWLTPDNTVQLLELERQTVDDILEETNDVVDTLVIQYFDQGSLERSSYVFPNNPQLEGQSFPFSPVPFDQETGIADESEAARTIRIPLTEDDVTMDVQDLLSPSPSWDIDTWEHMLDEPVEINQFADGTAGLGAATITFIPGTEYNDWDTILDQSAESTPAGVANTFGSIVVIDEDVALEDVTPFRSHNSHVHITRPFRYEEGPWGEAYVPAIHNRLYGISFHASFQDVTSIEDEALVGLDFGDAYPNPVNQGDDLQIEFSMVERSNVEIAVYDLLGQQISHIDKGTLGAGEHSAKLSTGNMNTGMYLYRVKAGDEQITRRISVK